MTTPEQIEAIDSGEYKQILELCDELHAGTVGALEMLSAKDLEEEELLRKRIISKLDEAASNLSVQIADLEALKRELRIKRGYAVSDRDRLESHKISIYIKEKELRTQSSNFR